MISVSVSVLAVIQGPFRYVYFHPNYLDLRSHPLTDRSTAITEVHTYAYILGLDLMSQPL